MSEKPTPEEFWDRVAKNLCVHPDDMPNVRDMLRRAGVETRTEPVADIWRATGVEIITLPQLERGKLYTFPKPPDPILPDLSKPWRPIRVSDVHPLMSAPPSGDTGKEE